MYMGGRESLVGRSGWLKREDSDNLFYFATFSLFHSNSWHVRPNAKIPTGHSPKP